MTRIYNLINGVRIEVGIVEEDYAKIFQDDKLTDALVQYDATADLVRIDKRADEHYLFWAATHEVICCGKYQYLAPDVPKQSRCGAIDLMLIKIMPESYRKKYRLKRLEMFNTVIDKNLNPDMNPVFKKAIELLSN